MVERGAQEIIFFLFFQFFHLDYFVKNGASEK